MKVYLISKYIICIKIRKELSIVFSIVSQIALFSITASDVSESPRKRGTLPYVVKIVSNILISILYFYNFT